MTSSDIERRTVKLCSNDHDLKVFEVSVVIIDFVVEITIPILTQINPYYRITTTYYPCRSYALFALCQVSSL